MVSHVDQELTPTKKQQAARDTALLNLSLLLDDTEIECGAQGMLISAECRLEVKLFDVLYARTALLVGGNGQT